MTETKHASLGPSSSSRWLNCTASPHLIDSLDLPEEEPGFPSREGTYAHAVMETIILSNFDCVVGESSDWLKRVVAEVEEGLDEFDFD